MELIVATTVVLMLVYALPVSCDNRQVYEEITAMRGHGTADAHVSASTFSTIRECGQYCFQEARCLYFRFHDSACYLYETIPGSSGDAPGNVYFGVNPCPVSEGYNVVPHPRLCYKVVTTEVTWSEARDRCVSEGARLMVLSADGAFDMMLTLIPAGKDVWVGMNQTDGEWMWSDGSTNVRLWMDNEPDNVVSQQCVAIKLAGLTDLDCADLKYYLCEVTMFV